MKNLPQKIKSRKLNSRVDLTAMVSVSFLLIIFFMVVGELSKPKVVDLSLPDNGWTCGDKWYGCGGGERTTTILLGENNRLIFYTGILAAPIRPAQEMNYDKEGIRKELLLRNKEMLNYSAQLGKPGRGIIVIIKPSKKSNFKNLIDILDEMEITKIGTYTIVNEFTPEETKLLALK